MTGIVSGTPRSGRDPAPRAVADGASRDVQAVVALSLVEGAITPSAKSIDVALSGSVDRTREIVAGLADDLAVMADDPCAIERLDECVNILLAVERGQTRHRIRATFIASIVTAALLPIPAVLLLGLSPLVLIVTGLLASIGAGLPGAFLLGWPEILDRLLARLDGWRGL